MESENAFNNDEITDSSKLPYSKVNTQEDTVLELNEKKQNLFNAQNNNNNEVENDDENNGEENLYNTYTNSKKAFKSKGILNKKLSYYFIKKIGNTYTFFGDKDGSPLIVIGPHWPMYFCFCSFVCIGYLCFFYYFWTSLGLYIKVSGVAVLLMFFISYTMTFLVNPGIPKYDEKAITGEPREKYRFCELCKIWVNMDNNTAHCFDCNVCVEGYDHHCPWTGKCIGKNNLKYFYTFLMSVLFIFSYFVLVMTQMQSKMFKQKKRKRIKFTNIKKKF